MAGYPQVLYWIVEYEDGTALPQYDPETGQENLWCKVDTSKLCKAGWYPFTPELAEKTGNTFNPFISPVRISLSPLQKPIMHRTGAITCRMDTGEEVSRSMSYVIGIKGKFCLWIDENGVITNWEP